MCGELTLELTCGEAK